MVRKDARQSDIENSEVTPSASLSIIFQRIRHALYSHWPLAWFWLVITVLYYRMLNFPLVNWDDSLHVYRNPAILHPETLTFLDRWFPKQLGYPMPLTLLSYRLERYLWIANPDHVPLSAGSGFHLTNLLLAYLLIFAVYLLCCRIIRHRWAAIAACTLFVLHPLLVEPIVWISGRKDMLAAVFSLLGLYQWLKYIEHQRSRVLMAFVIFSICALLSKPNAVYLVAVALYVLITHRITTPTTNVDTNRTFLPAWFSIIFLVVLGIGLVGISYQWNRNVGGVEEFAGLGSTFRRTIWALGFHLSNVLSPINLRPKYVLNPNHWIFYGTLAGLAIVLAIVGIIPRRKSFGALQLGTALALFSYLPVSNLVPLRRYLADIYLLLPLVGLTLVLGAGLAWLFQHGSRIGKWFITVAALGLACFYFTLSWHQVEIWSGSTRLWHHVWHYSPQSPQVCRMLGHAYNEQHQFAQAVGVYEACSHRFGIDLYANNLGITHYLLGNYLQAQRYFNIVLQKNPRDIRAKKYLQLIKQTIKQ